MVPEPWRNSSSVRYLVGPKLGLAWQVSKVERKARMEVELSSLGSQLERAKLAQTARCHRLQAAETKNAMEASPNSKPSEVKRTLFSDGSDVHRHGRCARNQDTHDRSAACVSKGDLWMPELEFLNDEAKVALVVTLIIVLFLVFVAPSLFAPFRAICDKVITLFPIFREPLRWAVVM